MGAFPEDPGIALSLGHAERAHGAQTKAIEAYKHAAERRPDFGDAYWSLANLKTYRFKTSELEHMQALLDTSTTGLADRYHLAFALGKALEDHQAFDQSFACYALGNALKQSEVQYRADLMERDLTLQAQILTADFFKSRPASGASAPDPIFIVGLPRAGSTLSRSSPRTQQSRARWNCQTFVSLLTNWMADVRARPRHAIPNAYTNYLPSGCVRWASAI